MREAWENGASGADGDSLLCVEMEKFQTPFPPQFSGHVC